MKAGCTSAVPGDARRAWWTAGTQGNGVARTIKHIGNQHCAVQGSVATSIFCDRTLPDDQDEPVVSRVAVEGQVTGDEEDAGSCGSSTERIVSLNDVNHWAAGRADVQSRRIGQRT